MNYMYVKNSSPMQTRQVVNNLIAAMTDADLNILHIDTLRHIVKACDEALADQAATR